MEENNDEFFINLTMTLSQKDDALYNEWSSWCANSGNRYYIAGQVEEDEVLFYTVERTQEEINTLSYLKVLKDFVSTLNSEDEIDKKYIDLANRFIENNPKKGRLIPYELFRRREEQKLK